ncbi:MAG TPA: hypothetical protein PKC29_03895 [Thermodesulfobacteriota bacterium]|nr:hypothetical protein [Thermodesulfobacteriota bacterium]
MTEKKKVCMLCGKPSDTSICDACKANVQGEALGEKRKVEKQVSVVSEVDKDRLTRKRKED